MISRKYWIHIIVFICWLIAVLAFLEKLPAPVSVVLPILGVIHIVAIAKQTNLVCYFLPYAIILSPLFGAMKVGGLNMIFSDILILYCLLILLVFKPNKLMHSRSFYLLLMLLIVTSIIHFLMGDIVTLKPLVSILEIFIVYVVAKEGFKTVDINLFFNSFCLAVALGVLLMFVAFYQGINLNDYNGDSNVLTANAGELDLNNYRLSFFYTNFPFLIASVFFILMYRVVTVKSLLIRLIFIGLVILTCLALIASGNKTTLFATVIIIVISVIIFDYKRIFKFQNLIYISFFLPAVYYVVYNIFLNEQNQDLFTSRMLSSDSLIDRFGVYVNTFHILADSPYRIFIGYGPDFLTGGAPHEIASTFKINYYTKAEQGAVDSGILTFILDYGLLLFVIIAYPVLKMATLLTKKINHQKLLILRIFMIFILSGLTQLIGISKIFWFFVLIFALAKSLISKEGIMNQKIDTTIV
jgi:hypothetical protein